MKKYVSLLLALLLILQLAACGGGGGGTGTPGTPEAPETPVNDPEKDPYQTYVYEEGGITLAVPWSLPAEPEKTDDGILFRDPEGAWTVSFEPLTPSEVKHRVHNTRVAVESFRDFGYYADIEVEDTSFGGYPALRVSFSRNPDWVEATMGYTTSYTEPHQIYVIDYTDVVIAGWGGLRIDVSAPEKSTADLSAILADPDVQTLLGHVQFAQPSTELTASIPGITVNFPIRWNIGDDGKSTLWGGFQGEQSGNVYVGSTIYADPVEAAGFVREDYRTLDMGGRSWYGGVRHVEMTSSDYYQLLLYTEFTQYHALQVKLNLNGADEAAIWAFAEGEVFRGILESIQLEPEAFQDPEKDRMDASGFECNNINEISAYTGGQADITIPAVIGSNEIVGVNTDVFKNNTALRSVTLEEGIQYIEYGAFRGCTNLETVVLPNSLTYIDSYAFEGCTSLRTVQFGENLSVIESDAFSGCAALGEVKLPGSVTRIGSSAFLGAGDGSGSFLCPAEGVVYGYSALARSGFDAVEIGPGADLSDHHILSEARVNRVVIGPGCRALGEYFLLCPTYNDETGMWHYVDTPLTVSMSGVEQIGDYAFEGRVGLQEIDLPRGSAGDRPHRLQRAGPLGLQQHRPCEHHRARHGEGGAGVLLRELPQCGDHHPGGGCGAGGPLRLLRMRPDLSGGLESALSDGGGGRGLRRPGSAQRLAGLRQGDHHLPALHPALRRRHVLQPDLHQRPLYALVHGAGYAAGLPRGRLLPLPAHLPVLLHGGDHPELRRRAG